MSRRLSVLLPVIFGILLIAPLDTQARRYPYVPPRSSNYTQPKPVPNQTKPSPPKSVAIDGTVLMVGSQGFKVNATKEQFGTASSRTSTGATKEWLISPTRSTTWLVTGTATPSYLKPSMTVVFKAELDDAKQPKSKISTLTIVSPTGHLPGIKADDGSDPLKPKDAAANPPTATKPVKTKAKKKDAAPAGLVNQSRITGKITSCNGNRFTVSAGGSTVIHAELDDNPTINVLMNDPKVLAVGAKVTIHGQAIERKQIKNANYCQATDIKVVLALPLTGKEKSAILRPELLPETSDPNVTGDQPKD